MQGETILSTKETSEKVSLSRQTIYRLVKEGKFPAQIQVSPGRVGYLESEVTAWIESRGKVGK